MTVQAGLAVQCVAPGRAYGHPASPSPQRWRDQHGASCRAQAPTRPPATTISTVLHTEELSMRARAAVQGNDSAQTTTMGCRAGIAAQGSGWPGACADLLRPSPGLLAGLVVNSLVYLLGIRILRKGLTWVGYSSSWVLGTLSYAAFGYKGYLIVCLYFILGTLVRWDEALRVPCLSAQAAPAALGTRSPENSADLRLLNLTSNPSRSPK